MRIEYETKPKVLLLGNGINRAYGFASWDELLNSIQTKVLDPEETESLKNIPYPLRPVILTEDHLSSRLKEISGELSGLRAPEAEEALLRAYLRLPMDAVLTTNYTYELEKALDPKFVSLPNRHCKARHVAYDKGSVQTIRQMGTYFEVDGQRIWHIHGEAARPDTMVLGHYFYGKLLSKMQKAMPLLIGRRRSNGAKGLGIDCRTWLDYFMTGDVYIVGFGMDASELDLWWLVNCKKRNFPDTTVTLFKPGIRTEERLLAEAYGVRVISDGLTGTDYRGYYAETKERLEALLS